MQPLRLSLRECVTAAFAHNTEIRVDSFLPALREQDILSQEAAFDPNLSFTGRYEEASSPTNNFFDLGNFLTKAQTDPNASLSQIQNNIFDIFANPIAIDTTTASLNSAYNDPLRWGARWSSTLFIARSTSNSANAFFPESYYANLQFEYTQSFLRGFGRKTNETFITLARVNRQIDQETFRKRVQDTLLEVESAYWTLVYERQDLDVRNEALDLAQELLRLNKIRVDVGTLPPIDITQAEAGVASREEAVIVAQANIANAEDRLRRVMGLDPGSDDWNRPIEPTEDLGTVERNAVLDSEIKKALDNRTDLQQARLTLESADVTLEAQRNQLKYRLDGTAAYAFQGLAGDTNPIDVFDPNGNRRGTIPAFNSGVPDALEFIRKGRFPTWSVSLVLGIPIGNRSAEAAYTRDSLQKQQDVVQFENLKQAAIVAVGVAVRQVETDRKRIDAAEKNRVLQEKTVEAEQKKFENGLSTSFEVLQLQRDLSEARSSENAARRDYRISLANLDAVTGVLEKKLGVSLEDYESPAQQAASPAE
ncbi:MAG TPA: TolC family protein [Candidatus Saccharimonadales bacterium]|nr:TolC family protein [Candidatus Saccharimonadales bacterium]